MAEKPKTATQISLGGRTFDVRLTIGTLERIENATGMDFQTALGTIADPETNRLNIQRFRQVLASIIAGQAGAPDADAIGDLVDLASIQEIVSAIQAAMPSAPDQGQDGDGAGKDRRRGRTGRPATGGPDAGSQA